MNELIDQLEQMIEERLIQLKLKKEREDGQTDQRKKAEDAIRMDKILNSLPEEERDWLEAWLLERVDVPEQEQKWYYKAGLADAVEVMCYLKN